MTQMTPPDPAGPVTLSNEATGGVGAARGAAGWFGGPLMDAIRSRLSRMTARFGARSAKRRRPQLPPMSRRVAWLFRNAPGAERMREQLHEVLRHPETAALVAAAPQARRSLRLLCQMLGVKPPPGLFPRRSPRGRSAPSAKPATGGRASPRSRS